ncbi:enoyl-CoA hydratase/isomerase family protein [Actinomadura mexicana]|uniref:Short chain enoyl-CoA hydratase n=1 Tax=Actinomadura mexicana TaxID=134959 RepID=A0A239C3M3_9ACTN|nr:enoyl-CoA hydratase/isomerase family protein [Actinomadura mexicana]SNS14014.1 short chain enoyl-CoA hydratase [Actinomadura mexicana]
MAATGAGWLVSAEPQAVVGIDGAVAELILNRPRRLNAITEEMLLAIEDGIDLIEARRSVRALVVRGEGRAFCAGADLAAAGLRLDDADELAGHAAIWRRVLQRLESSPVPSIAAVHGVAVAGGLELTLACDMVAMAADARIGDGHAKWGLFPSGGVTQRLPRTTGKRHASWLLFSGELVDAREALAIGLVNAVVPPEELLDHVRDMARTIAARSPAAVASMKQAVRAGSDGAALGAGLDLEGRLLQEHRHRPDMKIGQAAFTSRTDPRFPDL